MGLLFNNAIGWAQFRMRGGWKSVSTVSGVYLFLVLAGLILSTHLALGTTPNVYTIWISGLLGFQILLLVMIMPARAGAAVRSDVTSKVLESHRLMPTSGIDAIVGYVFGPNLNALALALVTLVVGTFVTANAGIAVDRWIIANGLVLVFGLLISAIGAFGGFFQTKFAPAVIALVVGLLSAREVVSEALPGVLVFCGPFIRKTVFSMQAGVDVTAVYQVSVFFQCAAGALFLGAAARRYRRAGVLGFTPRMAMALLSVWVAASVIAIMRPDFRLQRLYGVSHGSGVAVVGSILASLAIALVPVSAAARGQSMREISRDAAGRYRVWNRLRGLSVVLLSALVVAVPLAAIAMRGMHDGRVPCTVVVCLSFLGTLYGVFRIVYRVHPKAFGIGCIFIVLLWVIPPLVAIVPGAMDKFETDTGERWFGPIASFGPPGAIAQMWAVRVPVIQTWGIIGQAAIALGMALLVARTGRVKRTRAAAAPA